MVKSPTDVLVIAWPSGHHRPEQQSASWARDKYLWKSVENFHIYLHSFTIRVSDEKDIECGISCRIKHFHPSRDGGTGRRSGLKILSRASRSSSHIDANLYALIRKTPMFMGLRSMFRALGIGFGGRKETSRHEKPTGTKTATDNLNLSCSELHLP